MKWRLSLRSEDPLPDPLPERTPGAIDALVGDLMKFGKDCYEVGLALAADLEDPGLGSRQARSVVLMVAGIVLATSGHKALHSILFVVGVVGAGYGAFTSTCKLDPFVEVERNEVPIFAGVAVMAMLGGLLAVWLMKIGVVVLGALLGASASSILLSLDVFDAEESSSLVFVASSLTSAVLAYFLSDTTVVLATALLGASVFLLGLDFLTKLGVRECLVALRLREGLPANHRSILGSLGLMALAGSVVQYKFL